jgi:hypothetical protein
LSEDGLWPLFPGEATLHYRSRFLGERASRRML